MPLMSNETGDRTRYLIPFAYILTLIVPITAPLFSLALYREHQQGHAVAVVVFAIVWSALLFFVIL